MHLQEITEPKYLIPSEAKLRNDSFTAPEKDRRNQWEIENKTYFKNLKGSYTFPFDPV